jgi:hypothetical protein
MVEVVRGLDLTEGDMMGVAVKLVLNSWGYTVSFENLRFSNLEIDRSNWQVKLEF